MPDRVYFWPSQHNNNFTFSQFAVWFATTVALLRLFSQYLERWFS